MAGHPGGLRGFDIIDAFGIVVALIGEDFIETGWSRDPSKRSEAYKTLNIEVAPLVTERSTDPMSTPPPAHLAEDQLAEFRSLMARPKGESPPSD